ncbi:MAG: UDP-N-acetylmuramoyl-L-alanyl-D-glutamate--2,6-diaminopimelate ligase [Oscillospiraceae bacterium]|nr:UDP-N-acetylmuramoyl-L-alanyl-D-glutamate--2,6-diaminopimelate ligase [Oscillospiraceae bacterium]
MKLKQLLQDIRYTTSLPDIEIPRITADSRQVTDGCLFLCLKGMRFDGHDAAAQAVEDGAAAVVCEKDLALPCQILVENTRSAYGQLCANFYGRPSEKMKLIGITGTNGKTTITYLMKHILESAGKKVGLIGTIRNEIGALELPAKNTTPDPAELHVLFMRMLKAGCEYVVMETSSHALEQQRLNGCHFAAGVFTNLTRDHLDYHLTMENYYQAKKSLFDHCDAAIVNLDDEYGRRLAKEAPCRVFTFSTHRDEADYTARNISCSAQGSRFTLVGNSLIGRIQCPMPGEFAVSNAMAAATAALSLGLTLEQVSAGLQSCPGVRGRTEVLPTGTDYTVIRDYAHTPDGLEKVLSALKGFCQGRLVVMFGCPGNRDPGKRPQMGQAVARYADYVIITSDNPRDEDPEKIIDDAMPGLQGFEGPCERISDRYSAISRALDIAQKDDILILAGKGHEDYQVLNYGTIHFDEREVVLQLLEEKKKNRGQQK